MRMVLFGIAAFRWFWPHVLCMLIVCRPESCCMCVYNTHARSSADSSRVWSVFVMFSLAYFGSQPRILFPAKRYFEGPTTKYFRHENICVYGSQGVSQNSSLPSIHGKMNKRKGELEIRVVEKSWQDFQRRHQTSLIFRCRFFQWRTSTQHGGTWKISSVHNVVRFARMFRASSVCPFLVRRLSTQWNWYGFSSTSQKQLNKYNRRKIIWKTNMYMYDVVRNSSRNADFSARRLGAGCSTVFFTNLA
jgi:hypothetical protein